MSPIEKINPLWFLVVGTLSLSAAHLVFSVDALAWFAYAPFLLYLRYTQGWRSRLVFVTALIVAWTICTLKIITEPLPVFFVFLYSIPLALFQLPGYFMWDRFKQHPWAIFLFPAVMSSVEWLQYTFTPFASWGVAAYTQSHNIALMQTVSLFGLPGLSFLIYWVNAALAETTATGKWKNATSYTPLTVLLALSIFGSLRYDVYKSKGRDTITVAAIGTHSTVGGLPLPPKAENDRVIAGLFKRSREAAQANARLLVWNEAATFVLPGEEPAWIDSLSALAAECRVSLVAAYIIPLSETPLRYENKYLFFNPEGQLVYTYHKHQPVPGEPAVNGTEPLQIMDVEGVKTGAVICYDYDFPYLAKGFGELGADLVAIPSSDWRGIDPIHTKMAAFRAVEQGHSILRSTRFGLSAAISPVGDFAAQMSSFDEQNKIMIAHLPRKKLDTLYAFIGDVFVYACMVFIGFFLFFRRKTT